MLHARNPERHLHVGGNVVNFGPVNGAPNISDLERGRRYGDIAAFRDILRLTQASVCCTGRAAIVVEPVDVPVPVRHLDMLSRPYRVCGHRLGRARRWRRAGARTRIALSAIEHGCSIEDLAARPTLMTVTNVNSPRRVDEEILDNIMIMARHGQCVVITPFTLMGAMAPVTLAGALAQQTAEALAIIVLVPADPARRAVVMGGFTSNVDMRTGSPAFGTPEYVHAALATRAARRGGSGSRSHQRRERLARGRCAGDLRNGVLAAGGDPEPCHLDQPCRRLARGRARRPRSKRSSWMPRCCAAGRRS